MKCRERGCHVEATHGVAYSPTKQRWNIRTGRYIAQARRCWCRWHATVQAVCHNAAGRAP